ncbi:hypothetical protein [Salmonella phage SPHG3]|uniref:Uncharacterized protein n=1 Tax=Salmonella phage SPHG3 TaxID=2801526 RepID=A0A7T7Z860_9CAUD|nr:hypothetical protein [Salmonella phage SPHG3]
MVKPSWGWKDYSQQFLVLGVWESASGIEPEIVRTLKAICISLAYPATFLTSLTPDCYEVSMHTFFIFRKSHSLF